MRAQDWHAAVEAAGASQEIIFAIPGDDVCVLRDTYGHGAAVEHRNSAFYWRTPFGSPKKAASLGDAIRAALRHIRAELLADIERRQAEIEKLGRT